MAPPPQGESGSGTSLRELLALARATGKLERVYLWGSFVTAKESPNDLDLLLLMKPDFTVDQAPDACRPLFEYSAAKMRFQADVFWSRSSIEEDVLRIWLDTYQRGRDFQRRGIIEVVLL